MARTVDDAARESRIQPNMTPMIDVVFQLIVVFLCSMRFRSLDTRIEAVLPEPGMRDTRVLPEPPRPVAAVRLRRDTPAAETRVYLLDAAVGPARESSWRILAERLAVLRGRHGTLRGEIDADPDVDHGEVMRALDSFVAASIADVRFRGAPGEVRGRRIR